MAEYIERGFALDVVKRTSGDYAAAFAEIAHAPAADVAPVVHGRWEWITEDRYRCNNCGRVTRADECMGKPMYSGCPYCRAKMDLEE